LFAIAIYVNLFFTLLNSKLSRRKLLPRPLMNPFRRPAVTKFSRKDGDCCIFGALSRR